MQYVKTGHVASTYSKTMGGSISEPCSYGLDWGLGAVVEFTLWRAGASWLLHVEKILHHNKKVLHLKPYLCKGLWALSTKFTWKHVRKSTHRAIKSSLWVFFFSYHHYYYSWCFCMNITALLMCMLQLYMFKFWTILYTLAYFNLQRCIITKTKVCVRRDCG